MPAHAGQAWHVYFVALAKDDGDGGCLREVRARRRGTRRSTKTNDVTTWIAVLWLAIPIKGNRQIIRLGKLTLALS